MLRHWSRGIAAGAMVLAGTACTDLTSRSSSNLSAAALTAALSSVPVGYGDLASSYVGVAAANVNANGLWIGGGREASFERGSMMGGGLNDAFAGGIAFAGRGGQRGPFGGGLPCTGTFDATTGRITCTTETRNGLTITRSAKYTDASGAVQQAFDSLLTNTVNQLSSVSGTVTYDRAADSVGNGDGHHRGWGHGRGAGGCLLGDTSTILTATTTVTSSSNRTVTGLAQGSTQRKVDGASAGKENTTGTSSRGSFTAARTVGDTTQGLVIPVQTGDTRPYPTAGTVIRAIEASLEYTGESAVTLSRREVVTYDGSATARVIITENGATKNCTRPLPRGPLTCS